MAPFGMHVRFTARAGDREELAAILLGAAARLEHREACLLYVVSLAPDDADTLWVTEAWSGRDEHRAALEEPATRALITRALPLLAGPPEATELEPIGGKGL